MMLQTLKNTLVLRVRKLVKFKIHIIKKKIHLNKAHSKRLKLLNKKVVKNSRYNKMIIVYFLRPMRLRMENALFSKK